MSTLLLAAAEEHEMWGRPCNRWADRGRARSRILLIALGILVAFGGGREHS